MQCQLSPSDVIEICGIIASLLVSIVAIAISIISLRQNSRMIYVVGRESNVLGYSFCNSRLIFEIATEIFQLPFLLRQERSFKNRFGQVIYEDILHFENLKTESFLCEEDIEDAARSIAVRILSEKTKVYPDGKNIDLIFKAIEKAKCVNKSER